MRKTRLRCTQGERYSMEVAFFEAETFFSERRGFSAPQSSELKSFCFCVCKQLGPPIGTAHAIIAIVGTEGHAS